jgi:ATP-binding cassette subfamily G (WHITE) protein 2 (SNQ2)
MYHWSALITSQLLVELPWNVMGSIMFFVCWYWTVGFENSRAGYTFLLYGIMFPIYYTTIAQAVASMAPNAEIAGVLFSFLFSFVLTFNGVFQPFALLGWWQWMYRLSPFTYLIEGLVGQAIGQQEINCATKELAQLQPPSGSTCGSYMQSYITSHGGYLLNSNATSGCLYCSARTTDEFFGPTFNISYSHHWRDAGLFAVYIAFNVVALFVITYLFRVRSPASLIAGLRRRWAKRKSPKVSTST